MTHAPDESTSPNAPMLRRAMAGITALDVDAISSCLHDTCVLQLPYEAMVPDLDRDGFITLFGRMFTLYRQFTITISHIYDLQDTSTLIARYTGDCIGRIGDVPYANEYLGIFEFTDGLISSWREYDNPMIVIAARELHDVAASASGPPAS